MDLSGYIGKIENNKNNDGYKKTNKYTGNTTSGNNKKWNGNTNNGGWSNRNNQGMNGRPYDKSNEDSSYVGAPYNFIAIPKNVYDPTEPDSTKNYLNKKTPAHNVLDSELYTGNIRYSMTAKTDIAVGGIKENQSKDSEKNSVVRCYRTVDDNLAIPGSTIRGLVKSNAMLLSFASFKDDIADYRLMYRELASTGKLKDTYSSILGIASKVYNNTRMSLPENVKAGYLVCEEGKYLIYGTVNDNMAGSNYYAVSEKHISENPGKFEYLYTPSFGHSLQYNKYTKFIKKGKTYDAENRMDFQGGQKGKYVPFYKKVSFNTNKDNRIEWIGAPDDAAGSHKGYIIGTGPMQRKKALYLFDEIDRDKCIKINDESINSFKVDYNNKKKSLSKSDPKLKEKMAKYFDLPELGNSPRPVFYIERGSKIYFGYTPNLRIFYEHSIQEGLKQTSKPTDMVRELFGYADKESSFKSRVSFSEAIVWDDKILETESKSYLLGGPKASSYLDYLKQYPEKADKTYNDDDFELRGVKQYWLRNDTVSNGTVIQEDNGNENVRSKFTAVPKGAVFEGTVRFNNLTKEELGLLLYSLELNSGESIQNVGKAKAFGYGAVSVSVNHIESFNNEKAYSLDDFVIKPYVDITASKGDLENSFKHMILDWYNNTYKKSYKDIEEVPNLRDLFTMKRIISTDKDIRFMTLKEYNGNGRKPLPRVDDYKKKWGKV